MLSQITNIHLCINDVCSDLRYYLFLLFVQASMFQDGSSNKKLLCPCSSKQVTAVSITESYYSQESVGGFCSSAGCGIN